MSRNRNNRENETMEWIAAVQKAVAYMEEHLLEEINYEDISFVLKQLEEFTETPAEAVNDLKVFDLEDLLEFLKRVVEEW